MDESLTIRLSSLEHYVYCPRQCALIDVEGQWEDNRHIVKGHRVHTRADSGDTTQSGSSRWSVGRCEGWAGFIGST